LFERIGTRALTPRAAASIAHALVVGLDTNTLFDRALTRETARALFRAALRELAGLADAPSRTARMPAPRRTRSARTGQRRETR
jgi:hypothetical protein